MYGFECRLLNTRHIAFNKNHSYANLRYSSLFFTLHLSVCCKSLLISLCVVFEAKELLVRSYHTENCMLISMYSIKILLQTIKYYYTVRYMLNRIEGKQWFSTWKYKKFNMKKYKVTNKSKLRWKYSNPSAQREVVEIKVKTNQSDEQKELEKRWIIVQYLENDLQITHVQTVLWMKIKKACGNSC